MGDNNRSGSVSDMPARVKTYDVTELCDATYDCVRIDVFQFTRFAVIEVLR